MKKSKQGSNPSTYCLLPYPSDNYLRQVTYGDRLYLLAPIPYKSPRV
ncbi:hypothetical protein [Calothrix sp. PCC 7507]|nr:hypothetical protein [Calothrix sp. PCC 7507]